MEIIPRVIVSQNALKALEDMSRVSFLLNLGFPKADGGEGSTFPRRTFLIPGSYRYRRVCELISPSCFVIIPYSGVSLGPRYGEAGYFIGVIPTPRRPYHVLATVRAPPLQNHT